MLPIPLGAGKFIHRISEFGPLRSVLAPLRCALSTHALAWLEERGFKAEKPTIGRFRDIQGKPIGMQTVDGKTGFRIEFDERSGAHINVWSGKEKGPHFTFDASESTVTKLQGKFGC